MLQVPAFELFINPRHGVPGVNILPDKGFRRAKAAITAWPGYLPTPLCDLPRIAAETGVAVLRIKDESGRFGLGSFKALGGAYAVANLLAAELSRRSVARSADAAALMDGRYRDHTRSLTVTCATDGNHGRSVAWAAQRFHAQCVIFVHEMVSQERADAIACYGAEVVRVAGNYDDAVRAADRQAKANGWFVVSDTSYPGYTEAPRDVMQGYRLMVNEAAGQWTGPAPTHVFIQAGVGGVAAAVSVEARARFSPAPSLIVVEPERAACLLQSAKSGMPEVVAGELATVMASLACGEVSLLAWQELERAAWGFMSISDEAATTARQHLAAAGLFIGESGGAGLAGLSAVATDASSRDRLRLTSASRILLFATEGVSDPPGYNKTHSSRQS